jgi:hypothetical protein
MQTPSNYKEALKAYRKGFLLGLFTGIVFLLVIGKLFLVIPICLALLFGAVAFDRKVNSN